MTLIEVVAGLALLGSLLGAAVVAKGTLTRQWTAAQHRAEAITALETHFRGWAAGDDDAELSQAPGTSAWPTSGEGPLGDGRWWWRADAREVVSDDATATIPGLNVIRYSVFDPDSGNVGSSEDRAAAVIDVLAPYEPPPEVEVASASESSGGNP